MKERFEGIGSSDVPALLGVDKYRGPLGVISAKLGYPSAVPQFVRNAGEWGLLLERTLLYKWRERRGFPRVNYQTTRWHPDLPWARATPDARGRGIMAEVKNRSAWVRDQWGEDGTEDVPASVWAQCCWHMFVHDRDECDVGALINGNDFRVYSLRRRPILEATIVRAMTHWWENYLCPEVLDADNIPSIREAPIEDAKGYLRARYSDRGETSPVDLDVTLAEILSRRALAEEGRKFMIDSKDRASNELRDLIGNRSAIAGDWGKVTWKKQAGKVDWKAVAGEYRHSLELVLSAPEYTTPMDTPGEIGKELADVVEKHRGAESRVLNVRLKVDPKAELALLLEAETGEDFPRPMIPTKILEGEVK